MRRKLNWCALLFDFGPYAQKRDRRDPPDWRYFVQAVADGLKILLLMYAFLWAAGVTP